MPLDPKVAYPPSRPPRERDPVDVALGHRLRERRLSLGLSLADLAGPAGVTFQQIQKYESGVNRLTPAVLLRLASALGMTAKEVFPELEAERVPPRPGARGEVGRA